MRLELCVCNIKRTKNHDLLEILELFMHSYTAPVISLSLKTTSNHKRVMAIDEHQRHATKKENSRVKELAMVHDRTIN